MLPTPHTVTVRTPGPDGRDEFGNVVHSWTEHEWAVHNIAPGASEEPTKTNRDLSLIAYTLYGPVEGMPSDDLCQVRLPWGGEWFQVDRWPDDYTHGFFTHPIAGAVVYLKRADG